MQTPLEFFGPTRRFPRIDAVLGTLGDDGNPIRSGVRTVTVSDLIRMQARPGGCRCEEKGLKVGMTLEQVKHFRGCKAPPPGAGLDVSGSICPALDSLRRKMGH